MSFIDSLDFVGKDDRVRKFLFPKKIIGTWGNVIGAEKLLEEKPLQIGLSEQSVTNLINKDSNENAAILLDFGFEFHGGIRILSSWSACKGYPSVRVSFGESAMEAVSNIGFKNSTNDHSTRDSVVTLPQLSDMEIGQTGFRFVYIELLSENAKIDLKAVAAVFVYRDLEYKGTFECDDEKINAIYNTAAYTCHLNMQNMLWDGIKRDRLVWIGDSHPEMLTMRTVFGKQSILEESLDFVREQTPLPGWMNGMPSYSMWWLIILWDWFTHNGDEKFLLKQKDYAVALMHQLCDSVNEDGSDTIPSYFLDWPTNGTPDGAIGARALLVIALEKAEKLALFYGDSDLSALCLQKAAVMKKNNIVDSSRKTVTAFQILAGIKDAKEKNAFLLEGGAKGLSTFLSYYVLKAMALGGSMKDTLAVMKEYYGAMLDKGATTFWEDFNMDWLENTGNIDELLSSDQRDLHGDNGAFCYIGYRHSLCHGWSSGPVPFLAEEVLGIKILEIGCKKICIKPNLGDLKWAKGTYPTPFGIISVSHKALSDGTVETTVDAPKGIDIVIEK